MRFGICGGTFDPFHNGHLDPLLGEFGRMQWSKLIFVPANMQPFKLGQEITSPFHRFAMAVLATNGDDRLLVSPMELERSGVSYTVDTLDELRRQYPEARFDWVIGDDNLHDLMRWKRVDRLFELANVLVLTRNGGAKTPEALCDRICQVSERGIAGSIVFAANETVHLSATAIRGLVANGERITGMVDPQVEDYINRNGLYRNSVEGSRS